MELINKHLLNLANITKYGIILKRQINDNKPISDIMSFENFSLLTKEVINTIINNIPDTTNNKETYSCQIKPNIKYTGYFDSQNNQIIISKESIKKIYQGDILKLLIIFGFRKINLKHRKWLNLLVEYYKNPYLQYG